MEKEEEGEVKGGLGERRKRGEEERGSKGGVGGEEEEGEEDRWEGEDKGERRRA